MFSPPYGEQVDTSSRRTSLTRHAVWAAEQARNHRRQETAPELALVLFPTELQACLAEAASS